MRRLRTCRFTLTAGRVGRLRIALAVLAGLAGCVTPGGVRPQDFPAPVPVPISPPDTPALVIDRTRVGPLALLDQHVLPGSRARLLWRTGQNYFGADLESPVLIVHGARPGPVLCLVAGVHGDEINGVETVRRVLSEARPEALAGTLIGVPVVNLFGYQRGSRYLPDRRDLNRFFPGSRSGSIASRIAHSFFNAVVRQCDALVDFHTGSFDRANLPQVRADLSRGAWFRSHRGAAQSGQSRHVAQFGGRGRHPGGDLRGRSTDPTPGRRNRHGCSRDRAADGASRHDCTDLTRTDSTRLGQ